MAKASLYADSCNLWGTRNIPPNNPYDVRYLGTNVTWEFDCPNCGRVFKKYTADYPYCGPNVCETCPHCYSVMRLTSPVPVLGKYRMLNTDNTTTKRDSK